jgi:hypothetical protein
MSESIEKASTVSRPKRVKLSEKEILERMKRLPERLPQIKERLRAARRKSRD